MLMTQSPVTALVTAQDTKTYNSRNRSRSNTYDTNPDSAIDLSGSASSLERSSGDRNNYYNFNIKMNGLAGASPPGTLYVRALYDYEADDRTSLSFHEGDVIQVITQLESGWWDGVINGVRGWFPSNYCQIITSPDELPDHAQNGEAYQGDNEYEDAVLYEGDGDIENESDLDEFNGLSLGGANNTTKHGADFWLPQATPDGRLFYYNTKTYETSMELPLESPTSLNESGPQNRMHINIPEKTRPPPEMMARGLTREEDEDSEATSASELEGESLMMGSMSSLVSTMTHSMPNVLWLTYPRSLVLATAACIHP
jgi:son of sevenless-like protein